MPGPPLCGPVRPSVLFSTGLFFLKFSLSSRNASFLSAARLASASAFFLRSAASFLRSAASFARSMMLLACGGTSRSAGFFPAATFGLVATLMPGPPLCGPVMGFPFSSNLSGTTVRADSLAAPSPGLPRSDNPGRGVLSIVLGTKSVLGGLAGFALIFLLSVSKLVRMMRSRLVFILFHIALALLARLAPTLTRSPVASPLAACITIRESDTSQNPFSGCLEFTTAFLAISTSTFLMSRMSILRCLKPGPASPSTDL